MITAFFVCWLPYTILSVVIVVNPELYIPPLLATMPMYFAKTSPVYNPIIYFLSNKRVSSRKSTSAGKNRSVHTDRKQNRNFQIACDAQVFLHGVFYPTVPRCCSGAAVLRPLYSPRTHRHRHQHALPQQEEPAYFFEQDRTQQGVASVTLSDQTRSRCGLSLFICSSPVTQTCRPMSL